MYIKILAECFYILNSNKEFVKNNFRVFLVQKKINNAVEKIFIKIFFPYGYFRWHYKYIVKVIDCGHS